MILFYFLRNEWRKILHNERRKYSTRVSDAENRTTGMEINSYWVEGGASQSIQSQARILKSWVLSDDVEKNMSKEYELIEICLEGEFIYVVMKRRGVYDSILGTGFKPSAALLQAGEKDVDMTNIINQIDIYEIDREASYNE